MDSLAVRKLGLMTYSLNFSVHDRDTGETVASVSSEGSGQAFSYALDLILAQLESLSKTGTVQEGKTYAQGYQAGYRAGTRKITGNHEEKEG